MFYVNDKSVKNEGFELYLVNAKTNLKQANEALNNFLSGIKGFRPARRHEQLFAERVYSRAALVKAWIARSIAFLDEKLNNTINTANNIKSTDQLASMMGDWTKVIKFEQNQNEQTLPDEARKDVLVYVNPNSVIGVSEGEKVAEDILGILKEEVWSEKRISRGFPVPSNKELLYDYLETAFSKLKEARLNLDNYNSHTVVIDNTL